MTTYMQLDKCKLLCACRRTHSLCRLYFCRHCLDVRCGDCLSHEVDSHYCPNCLENMASAEAKMRKHRCGNCFDCPSCGHTLSTRATAVMQAKPDEPGKTMAQKAYYLICGFCRWSTRDSGIPDQKQSAGGWQETNSPHSKRISELVNSYHHLAVKEKADREWTKFVRKRNYMILLERFPVLNPRLRRYCSSSWTTTSRDTEPAKPVVIPAAEAPEKPPVFDLDAFIGEPLQLNKVTTIEQRLLTPLIQPTQSLSLEPRPKSLAVKRSLRCRQCEHNLSKADFNPSSIKFRINLSALYHVPEVRYIIVLPAQGGPQATGSAELYRRTSLTVSSLKSDIPVLPKLAPGKTQPIILTICNPAHRITTVSLRQLTPEEEAQSLKHLVTEEGIINEALKTEATESATSHVDSSGDTAVEDDRTTPCFSTVQLSLPSGEIKLAPRNDIAEYDENLGPGTLGDYKDDSKVIAFRRGNKIGIHAGFTTLGSVRVRNTSIFKPLPTVPEESSVPATPVANFLPLRAALRLRFDHKNTTSSLLSEHRAAHAAATLASASAVIAARASAEGEEPSGAAPAQPVPPTDQITNIEVTVLLDFGNMEI